MSSRLVGPKESDVRRMLRRMVAVASFLFLLCSHTDAGAPSQESVVPRVVWIEPVDSRHGSYRVVLEVDLQFATRGSLSVGVPPLFLGDQIIQHTYNVSYNVSGTLLYGFVEELPQAGDGVWSHLPRGSPASLEEARAIYVASGESYVPIDIPALLSAGEERRKRIIDVQIETRTDPGPPETTIYIVKLKVENCTAESFIEPGPQGTASRPTLYVEEEPADSTIFSDEEELVVAEFSVMPEENGEITLRYVDWRLTAPEPFTLLGQE